MKKLTDSSIPLYIAIFILIAVMAYNILVFTSPLEDYEDSVVLINPKGDTIEIQGKKYLVIPL